MLMAGLDGIARRLEPPAPIDADLYELDDDAKRGIANTPGSLDAVLDALERDHDFLLAGDVFTPDVIETWLELKRTRDLPAVGLRPHPWEFFLYYDA
jgi:glutamine synthetase